MLLFFPMWSLFYRIKPKEDNPSDDGFLKAALERLGGTGPSKAKEDAEVELLKADTSIKKAAAKGAKIANLRAALDSGILTAEQKADIGMQIYMLATEDS